MTPKKISLFLLLFTLFLVGILLFQNRYLITSYKNNIPQQVEGSDSQLSHIKLPDGFRISFFASSVPGARSMAVSDGGVVYVGTRGDKVYAVVDQDQDGRAESVVVVATGLDTPNGVAIKDGDLYVAEVSRILRYKDIDSTYSTQPSYEVVYSELPKDTHHGWKYIAFGPDGLLYIPIGAPCNVCTDQDLYSRIIRINVDKAQGFEVYATGIRNTVGFDWDPRTRALWFTDNGRDLMGDDLPPDELNYAPTKDLHFGFPYCHAGDILDPKFGKGQDCSAFIKPALNLSPHAAALGMLFYQGELFPQEYQNRVFIAEHGSWNRTTPIGYRIMMATVAGSSAHSYEEFATGWLQGQEALGRPVDVKELQDGSLLVSDDKAGAIYRIDYK